MAATAYNRKVRETMEVWSAHDPGDGKFAETVKAGGEPHISPTSGGLCPNDGKRYEHTRVCPGCSGGYVTRANRIGIQSWRVASTTVGMSRQAS